MRKLQKFYTIGWVLWGALFCALEFPALLNKEPGDTLSEHVWALLDLHVLFVWLLAGFMGWLCVHWLAPGVVRHWRRWWDKHGGARA